MFNVTVATKFGTTEVIPFGSMRTVGYFLDELKLRTNPECIFYSHERYVQVKNITEVISIKEEN